MAPRLVYSEQCPNCTRFIQALDATPAAASVQRYEVGTLTPQQLRSVQAVPTLVLDSGEVLVGTAAFQWLRNFAPAEMGGWASGTSLGYEDLEGAQGENAPDGAAPWASF